MTARLLTHAAAAALLALAIGAAPARAQSGTDQSGTDQTGTAQPPAAQPAPGQAMTKDGRMARVERHITELHRRLKITAAEESQWTAFAQVMRANAVHMEQAFQARALQGPGMNAVQDLQSYAAVAQAHAEDMQRLVAAFQTLYQSLTPQQQKTADQVFRDFEQRRERRPQAG
ncbi:MAG: Spy/CpxP family protein refolding chaperone [Rhodospirillales bacterium]|nr:Spy/CpxP family protein refolding chaperone [Rhodospirillales bacterium]